MDSPLRIAILLNPFDLGVKGGDYAPQLARELLGRGHAVRGFGAPPGVIPRSGDEPEGTGSRHNRAGVVGFQPDAIVAYDALSPAAFLGARAARKLDVPLVLVESGFSGSGRFHERLLRWLGQKLWGGFVRHTAARVVALDPHARDLALAEGFAADRIEIMPAGVNLATFRPGLTSGLISRRRIRGRLLLYVGRVGTGRGLDILIDAFAATVGQRRDWSLLLAGEGAPHERRALRAQVDQLGIGAHVHWLPAPRREELPGLMGSATLLALPAVDSGVRGRHIPRAMACGLPVIASALPRFTMLVEDGESGLVVEPGDREAWIAALSRAAGSPEARRRWGARSRELAEERLDWARVAEAFEGLLLKSRTSPGAVAEARTATASEL